MCEIDCRNSLSRVDDKIVYYEAKFHLMTILRRWITGMMKCVGQHWWEVQWTISKGEKARLQECILLWYSSRTPPVLLPYSSCTPPVLFLYSYSSCTPPVLLLYSSCTPPVLLPYSSCTLPVLFLYSSCTLPVLLLYSACTSLHTLEYWSRAFSPLTSSVIDEERWNCSLLEDIQMNYSIENKK